MSRTNGEWWIVYSCVVSRLPYFVELVEKFLVIFQTALSGITDSDKQEIAAYLTPKVCELWAIFQFIIIIIAS